MDVDRIISPSFVVIIDYGTGNVNSVKRVLDRLGVRSVVSASAPDVVDADKIILPGVGHFAKAMSKLREIGLLEALNEAVIVKRTPVLGICLGMELMAMRSEEGDAQGLGWLDAEAVRFEVSDRMRFKVPHMGWNRISLKKSSLLMNGVDDGSEFYFAHSYHLRTNDQKDVLSETRYESDFASSIEKGNIFGVQFHPEKSHDAGARILKNFIEI